MTKKVMIALALGGAAMYYILKKDPSAEEHTGEQTNPKPSQTAAAAVQGTGGEVKPSATKERLEQATGGGWLGYR